MKNKANSGLTLIELLITTTLLAIMGAAIFSTFSSGLKVWQRAQKTDFTDRAVKIALAEITKEIRNIYTMKGIEFEGGEDDISIPAYVSFNDEEDKKFQFGIIQYFFDESDETIMKRKKSYSHLYKTFIEPKAAPFLSNVRDFKIEYFRYNKEERTYEWVEDWDEANRLPSGIKLFIKTRHNRIERDYVKTIYLPLHAKS